MIGLPRFHALIPTCSRGLIFLLLFTSGACDYRQKPAHPGSLPAVDGERALALTAELVAIGPRVSGTAGAAEAANWIAGKCRQLGYQTRIDEWREETVAGEKTFRNVVAVKPGSGPGRILLGSHYDTKFLEAVPAFAGANDSGSSTGLLLELMRAVSGSPAFRELAVECVFFDGEEAWHQYGPRDGLHGSRRHARIIQEEGRSGEYRAMILLDMVGDADLSITLPMDSDRRLAMAVFAAAAERGVRDKFGYFPGGTILDDHWPFKELGIPSIDIIDFHYGPGNSYWHTAADTLDKLAADSLAAVGNVVLRVLWEVQSTKDWHH